MSKSKIRKSSTTKKHEIATSSKGAPDILTKKKTSRKKSYSQNKSGVNPAKRKSVITSDKSGIIKPKTKNTVSSKVATKPAAKKKVAQPTQPSSEKVAPRNAVGNTFTSKLRVNRTVKSPIIIPPKKYDGDDILKVYLVLKVAIFNHDIFGAFRNKDEAIQTANNLAFTEADGCYTFDVVEIPFNSLKEVMFNDFYGQSCEQKTIFSSSKKQKAPANETMLWGSK